MTESAAIDWPDWANYWTVTIYHQECFHELEPILGEFGQFESAGKTQSRFGTWAYLEPHVIRRSDGASCG